MFKKSKYLGLRKPTKAEAKKNIEVVFIRELQSGELINVYGCKCYDSWQQFGAPLEVLQDNCKNIESWSKKQNRKN